MVSAMFEEAQSISRGNRRDRHFWRFDQGFAGSSRAFRKRRPLIFEKASSMGLKSGEYGGR